MIAPGCHGCESFRRVYMLVLEAQSVLWEGMSTHQARRFSNSEGIIFVYTKNIYFHFVIVVEGYGQQPDSLSKRFFGIRRLRTTRFHLSILCLSQTPINCPTYSDNGFKNYSPKGYCTENIYASYFFGTLLSTRKEDKRKQSINGPLSKMHSDPSNTREHPATIS